MRQAFMSISGHHLGMRISRLKSFHLSIQEGATSPEGSGGGSGGTSGAGGSGGDYSSGASHVLEVIRETLSRHRELEIK